MPNRFSIGSIELTATGTGPAPAPRRSDDIPFRMLVMGNLRGHTPTTQAPRPRRIDLDNQDALLEKLKASVNIPCDGPTAPPLTLQMRSMDDFHPDQLIKQVPWFKHVLELRTQLNNPKTFRAAADQLPQWINPPSSPQDQATAQTSPSSPAPAETPPQESHDDMLERLLGKPGSGEGTDAVGPAASSAESAVQHLIQQAVGSSVVPKSDPQQSEVVAMVDRALAQRLNLILHDPGFQALEATWRGVDYLIKNLELDENLQLFIMDISRDELVQDLSSAAQLNATQFHQNIVAPTLHDHDAAPWAVWVGQYTFTHQPEDMSLLAAMGELAASAGAPLLTGLHTDILNALEQAEPAASSAELRDWNMLRQLPQASYLGLALPRFLGRLPYGEKTDPIETFVFTEITGTPQSQDYLWTHAAIACGCLLGQSFSQCGWDLGTSLLNELEGLPLHVYQEDGESKMTPCAEIWLNDLNSDTLLENGLIPLQSIQRRDAIRLPRFQSIRQPLTALAGRWSG